MSLSRFIVLISADRESATMRCGEWKLGPVPVSDLRAWLAFYRRLIRRRPASSPFYLPCVTAIETAMRRLGMDTSEPAEKGKAKR